jgi:ubiquinone/menaquinone biosynthesis C-methylase UbiE
MAFLDLFSEKADLYASARPHYPDSLFQFIQSVAPNNRCAWDCGTGNGQAAVSLASYFTTVYASDPSSEQIAHSTKCRGVEYSIQPAEATNYPDNIFDAICVAQALHWFDLPVFFHEVQRVIKPNGVFAAWGYSWFSVTPEIDNIFRSVILDVIAPDWAPQNAILWRGYKDISMPFTLIPAPEFCIAESWSLHQLLAFVHSWSATRHCMKRIGIDFFNHAELELTKYWGPPESPRNINMPLHLLVGKNVHAAK